MAEEKPEFEQITLEISGEFVIPQNMMVKVSHGRWPGDDEPPGRYMRFEITVTADSEQDAREQVAEFRRLLSGAIAGEKEN